MEDSLEEVAEMEGSFRDVAELGVVRAGVVRWIVDWPACFRPEDDLSERECVLNFELRVF